MHITNGKELPSDQKRQLLEQYEYVPQILTKGAPRTYKVKK